MNNFKRVGLILLTVLMGLVLIGCDEIDLDDLEALLESEFKEEVENIYPEEQIKRETGLKEDGYYTSKKDVALYIYAFGKLPNNYIRKAEAKQMGWDSSKGNLWEVADKKSIGGDEFGNREGLLPEEQGRHYYEADIDYEGGYRGAKRVVYSNDGLIYYTEDHYESFELLHGDE